jgi:transmembrane sensor
VNKDIYHILSGHFRGQLSERDKNILQSWLVQSEDNKRLLEELEQVWKITGELRFDLIPDVEEEWENFVKEINKPADKSKSVIERQIKLRQLLKIAAVLIPLILASTAGFFYVKNKPSELAVIHTGNEKKECILPDGSSVWVNHTSTFTYPKKFRGKERTVKLEGEAFFDVAKSKTPFIISTEHTRIIVVGTAFNVRSYVQENNTEVIVSRGKVIFENKSRPHDKTYLEAGERGICDNSSAEIRKETVTDFNLIGWKDDQLTFQNTSVSEIQPIISRYFNVRMQVSSSLEKCRFTGDFQKPSLDEILDVLSVSLGASYQVINDTVFLTGQGCTQ